MNTEADLIAGSFQGFLIQSIFKRKFMISGLSILIPLLSGLILYFGADRMVAIKYWHNIKGISLNELVYLEERLSQPKLAESAAPKLAAAMNITPQEMFFKITTPPAEQSFITIETYPPLLTEEGLPAEIEHANILIIEFKVPAGSNYEEFWDIYQQNILYPVYARYYYGTQISKQLNIINTMESKWADDLLIYQSKKDKLEKLLVTLQRLKKQYGGNFQFQVPDMSQIILQVNEESEVNEKSKTKKKSTRSDAKLIESFNKLNYLPLNQQIIAAETLLADYSSTIDNINFWNNIYTATQEKLLQIIKIIDQHDIEQANQHIQDLISQVKDRAVKQNLTSFVNDNLFNWRNKLVLISNKPSVIPKPRKILLKMIVIGIVVSILSVLLALFLEYYNRYIKPLSDPQQIK